MFARVFSASRKEAELKRKTIEKAHNDQVKAENAQKKQEDNAKKKKGNLLSGGSGKGQSVPSILLTSQNTNIRTFTAIGAVVDFDKIKASEDANDQITNMGPLTLAAAPGVAAIMEEKIMKSSMSIFQVQFPNSTQVKTDLRGQQPFLA